MPHIDSLLRAVREFGASDLHLRAGAPPMMRLNGDITPMTKEALTREAVELLLLEIMPPDAKLRYERDQDVDFAYEVPGIVRVRCNIYDHSLGIGGAMRVLPNRIFTFEQLGLPEHLKRVTEFPRGLVMVTGPPGSGKSTTLAALIDYINRTRRRHVITIEDPIEYRHENQMSLVTHREVGRNAPSYARALRAALREDPDVIMVGEMRDAEAMALAVTAAATGQLVLTTLHTPSAAQSIDRVLDSFEGERQLQMRLMLAESLRCVLAQRLLRRADGRGRVLGLEILMGNHAVGALVRERKTFQLTSVMQTSKREGMQTMDDAIAQLVRAGAVTTEEATAYLLSNDALDPLTKAPTVVPSPLPRVEAA